MNIARTMTFSLIAFGPFSGCLHGQITVAISGEIGSNETTWVWNGTSTVLSNTFLGSTAFGTNVNSYDGSTSGSGGLDLTDALNAQAYEGTYLSGSTDDGTGADFRPLGLFIDNDGSGFRDDFAWTLGTLGGVGESGSHSFVSGNTVSFTDYTVQFTGFDISDFSNNAVDPANLILNAGDSITATSSDLDGLTLNFSAIPEPSSALFLGLVSLGLVAKRNRIEAARSESRAR
ncbi:MAG: hypothetical protein AAF065_13835 [Verrucomicrobiota bacterium]